jgi:hypothetical protein
MCAHAHMRALSTAGPGGRSAVVLRGDRGGRRQAVCCAAHAGGQGVVSSLATQPVMLMSARAAVMPPWHVLHVMRPVHRSPRAAAGRVRSSSCLVQVLVVAWCVEAVVCAALHCTPRAAEACLCSRACRVSCHWCSCMCHVSECGGVVPHSPVLVDRRGIPLYSTSAGSWAVCLATRVRVCVAAQA